MELTEIREEIDRIDEELLRLFLERMELSDRIAAYKASRGLPIRNQEREAEILEKATRTAGKRGGYAGRFFSLLIELSRERQEEAYAGKGCGKV